MAPFAPYLVYGVVYTSRGRVPNSFVRVLDTTNNDSVQISTNDTGQYTLDLSNFANGYTIGSSYTIVSWDYEDNEYKSESITLIGESLNKDVYLDYRTEQNDQTRGSSRMSVYLVGNKPISKQNPMPIQNDVRQYTKVIAYNGALQEYIGEAAPGTPASSPKWRIQKLTYSGTSITNIQWADGNTEFDNTWDNRATYNYS